MFRVLTTVNLLLPHLVDKWLPKQDNAYLVPSGFLAFAWIKLQGIAYG